MFKNTYNFIKCGDQNITSEKTKTRNKYDYKTLMHSSKIGVLEKSVFTQTAPGLKLNWNPEIALTINTPVLMSIYGKS